VRTRAPEIDFEEENIERTERHLDVTEDDLLEAKEIAATFTLEDLRRVSRDMHTFIPLFTRPWTKLLF
jgi:hypothetical protein